MKICNAAPPAAPVILSALLDDPLGTALNKAAADAMMSRAGLARRLIAEGLRRSGYMPALSSSQSYQETAR